MWTWESVDFDDVVPTIAVHYPAGEFRLGVDQGNRVCIVPNHLSLGKNVRELKESVPPDEIPSLIKKAGFTSQPVFVWVRRPDPEESDSGEAHDRRSGLNELNGNKTALNESKDAMEIEIEHLIKDGPPSAGVSDESKDKKSQPAKEEEADINGFEPDDITF